MSNIRLNTIVPDVLDNPQGIITLPGSLSVLGLSSTSILDASSPSSASVVFSGGLGIGLSMSLGGDIKFSSTLAAIHQDTDSNSDTKGLYMSSNSSTDGTRGSCFEIYGNQHATKPGMAILKAGSQGTMDFFNGSSVSARFLSTGTLQLFGTTNSTSSSTGSLVLTNGSLAISSTAAAVSATNGGAATIAGGLAVGGSVFVGGSISSSGAFSNSVGISVSATTESGNISTGSIVTAGGVAITKSLNVGVNAAVTGGLSVGGIVTFTNTDPACVSISGGISIAKGLSVSGAISSTGTMSTTGIYTNLNTTDATSTGVGAVVVAGGASIGGQLRVNGNIGSLGNFNMTGTDKTFTIAGTFLGTDTTDTVAVGSGSFVLGSGISVAKTARFGGDMFVSGNSSFTGGTFSSISSATVSITATTDSTIYTNGALIVAGGIGVAGTIRNNGLYISSNTTNAVSMATGSIVTLGGIGIAKDVFVGGGLTVGGSTAIAALTATGITHTGVYVNTNTTDSSSSTTGSAVFSGGIGVLGSIYTGGNIVATGSITTGSNGTVAGVLSITNVTDSANLSNGAIICSGGVAITKALRVGGNSYLTGTLSNAGTAVFSNTTGSTGSSSGSVVVVGGVGVGENLYVAGILSVTGAANFTGAISCSGTLTNTSTSATSVSLAGGISITKSATIGTTLTVQGASTLSTLSVSSTSITGGTQATAYNTGALIVTGGVGISGNLILNSMFSVNGTSSFTGSATFTNISDSSLSTNGSVVFSGGVGIMRNLNVGGGLSVTADLVCSGAVTSTTGVFVMNTIAISDVAGLYRILSPAPGIRIAGTTAIKGAQYGNAIDLFSLGNVYTDTDHEALQISTTSTDTFTILTRNAGTGVQRKLMLQAGGGNSGQITLNTNGTVLLSSSTVDSTTSTDGSVVVLGGLGVGGSVSVKKVLQLLGSTSGKVGISSAAVSANYNLTLPTSLPASSNYALVSTTGGVLSWSEMTTTDPNFNSLNVTGTTDATSTTTGSIKTPGGLAVGKNVYLGGGLYIAGSSNNLRLLAGTSDTFIQSGSSTTTGSTSDIYFSGINGTPLYAKLGLGGMFVYNTTTSTSSTTGSLVAAGGIGVGGDSYFNGGIYLSGSASSNMIVSSANGQAVPALTTRSVGTRFVLYPSITSSSVDYAIGVQSGYQWYSVGSTSEGHKWYSGTTNTMTLQGSGTLLLSAGGKLSISGSTSGVASIKAYPTSSTFDLTLPASLPSSSGSFMTLSSTGQINFTNVGTFSNLSITDTTSATALGVGALIVAGGGSFSQGLAVKGSIVLYGATSGTVTLSPPSTTSSPTFTLPGNLPSTSGQVLSSDASGVLSWISKDDVVSYATAAGANNTLSPANVGNLAAVGSSYTGYILVTMVNTTSANSATTLYLIEGVKQPDSGSWLVTQKTTGPQTGIVFSINSSGQVQYTSTNVTGWVSTSFDYYPVANTVTTTGNYESLNVTGTTDSTGYGTGTLLLTGGGSIGKSLSVGSPTSAATIKLYSSASNAYNFSYCNGQTTNYFRTGSEYNSGTTTYSYNIYNQAGNGVYLASGATAWSSNSDERLKKDIIPISSSSSLDMIERLTPVTFQWNNDSQEEPPRLGLIAQQVRDVIPDIVTENSEGMLGVSYGDLIPVLLAAVKELSTKNKDLNDRIELLESTNRNPF